MKSTFPYYGGRFYQIKNILEILEKNLDQFDVVVDVFGGSGKVLLNIPDDWKKVKVYNDVNKDLYVTFKVLQDNKKRMQLERKLRFAFPHESIFQELKLSSPKNDVDIAFKTIYLHTFSFSGAGTAFKRYYKKANLPPLGSGSYLLVKKWIVENMDFRSLMKRYNRPDVLLYLDPPYLRGGDQYRYKFKMEDFVDLKALMDIHQGTYLMNLSMTDPEMIGIFGEPNKITEHFRSTMVYDPQKENRWDCGYWWKL